jgi:hypothetical protein
MKYSYTPGRIEILGRKFGLPMIIRTGFYVPPSKSRRLSSHTHDGHEITFVIKGGVSWELGDGLPLVLEGGDFALIQPNVIHHGTMNIIQPASIFWLVLNIEQADQLDTGFSDNENIELSGIFGSAGNNVWYGGEELTGPLYMLYSLLHEVAGVPPDRVDRILLFGMRNLLNYIISRVAITIRQGGNKRQVGKRIQRIIDYMDRNLQNTIRIEELASLAGISGGRLHTIFKNATGFTPGDYFAYSNQKSAVTACQYHNANYRYCSGNRI